MDFDTYDQRTIERCQGYISKFYGDELVRTHNFTNYLKKKITSDLTWDAKSTDTHTWCKAYLRQHREGGRNSRNNVKRQSKRKQNRAKKSKSGRSSICNHKY